MSALPTSIVAGTGGTAVLTLSNTSVYLDGEPAPFTFWLWIGITAASGSIVLANNDSIAMAAAQSGLQKSYTFTIPANWASDNAALASAKLVNPADGSTIGAVAQVVLPITKSSIIVPGGTVTW